MASPATRPTPTTDIGLSASRSAPLNAACQTPTIRWGTWTMASAVPLTKLHRMPGTAVGDCGT